MFDVTMLKESLNMFVFLAVELSLLYLIIAYAIGVLQERITPSKVQNILSSKKGKGYVIAAFLGAITPFCSCSTIPFLKGLLKARAGFGPMLTFLFASPLLNPIIMGLFLVTFGAQVTVFYFSVALGVSIIAGYVLEKLGFEKYVKDTAYVQDAHASACCSSQGAEPTPAAASASCCSTPLQPLSHLNVDAPASSVPSVAQDACCAGESAHEQATSCCSAPSPKTSASSCCSREQVKELTSSCCGGGSAQRSENKWLRIWHATWADFKSVLPYLFIGVTLGSIIYGFMPTEFITKVAHADNPWAIPVAAIIGIPLYIRAEAVIPLSAALAAKGMGLGAVMALIIGSAGASLTEVILLKAIFKNPMIIAFVAVILTMAVSAGFMHQWIF